MSDQRPIRPMSRRERAQFARDNAREQQQYYADATQYGADHADEHPGAVYCAPPRGMSFDQGSWLPAHDAPAVTEVPVDL